MEIANFQIEINLKLTHAAGMEKVLRQANFSDNQDTALAQCTGLSADWYAFNSARKSMFRLDLKQLRIRVKFGYQRAECK